MKLDQTLFGLAFQNPVLLAAGTCGFGRELAEVTDLDALGGFMTKSVTVEPRQGNPAPRVADLPAGMVNSIGLANPGLDRVIQHELPWLEQNVRRARVFVSVAGHRESEYEALVAGLDRAGGFDGFELNLSCPNDTRLGGLPFALDPEALVRVVEACRARTERPLLAKLAPNAPDIGAVARMARDAGADGVTVVNTLPALVLDPTTGKPELGAGSGGLSGPALRPVGVYSTWRARRATGGPVIGAGGILSAADGVQYLRAGASLLQIGTASFADPRAGERLAHGLARLGSRLGVAHVEDMVATAQVDWGQA